MDDIKHILLLIFFMLFILNLQSCGIGEYYNLNDIHYDLEVLEDIHHELKMLRMEIK